MSDDTATLLIVEDDPATGTFLADNLTADGYEVLVAERMRDALRLLETKFPDLVLVDLGLPDGSGFALVDRVREADGLASRIDPRTPLLVVSGRDTELDRVRGFQRGCDDYVGKPFSYPELGASISSTGTGGANCDFKSSRRIRCAAKVATPSLGAYPRVSADERPPPGGQTVARNPQPRPR